VFAYEPFTIAYRSCHIKLGEKWLMDNIM